MVSARRRLYPVVLLLAGATAGACGGDDTSGAPGVSVTGMTSTGDDTPMSTSTAGDDTLLTSTGSSSGGTTAATDSTSSTGSPSADSTTGDPPLSLDETANQLRCVDDQPSVRILLLPGQFDGVCAAPGAPPPGVAIINVRGWDGMAGEFEVTADGSSGTQAGLGDALQPATGTITLEVSAPWTLQFITYELASASMSASGTAELGLCRGDTAADPCL